MRTLNRNQLLAAETFSYSYDNYADHEGNRRFDEYMPHDARVLEKADREGWSLDRIAEALDVDQELASRLQSSFRDALVVVDAPHPAESFRRSVRQCIQRAKAEGLDSEEQIEALVIQICYRASDLSYLLRCRNEQLHKYSDLLRREPNVTYYDDSDA